MLHAVKTNLGADARQALADAGYRSEAVFEAASRQGRLIVYGDVTLFLGKPGVAGNCVLQSRFKRGDPVGFRMTAFDSETGEEGADGSVRRPSHLCRQDARIFRCDTAAR